jgi:large subunit ribosomal protein L24
MKHENFHVRKNDRVMVVSGKEKGKAGKVLKVLPKKSRVIIEKVNMVKRHQKASRAVGKGGIIEKEAPIHLSNVMVMCAKCNEAVRTGNKILEDGKKTRVCRGCGEVME